LARRGGARGIDDAGRQDALRRSAVSGYPVRAFLAGERAAGSAGIQLVAGLASVVLGIIAVVMTPTVRNEVLTLVALLVAGLTNTISGSASSGLVLSFMRPESQTGATVPRRGAEGCGRLAAGRRPRASRARAGRWNFPGVGGFKAQPSPAGRAPRGRPKKTSRSTIGQ
jgi:hypothetical protein